MLKFAKRLWSRYHNADIDAKINIECKLMRLASVISHMIFELID